MKTYITIVDPDGATIGYDGPFVAISHRILFENKLFHGFESSAKLFRSHAEQMNLLNHCIAQPDGAVGTIGKLSWSVEHC